MSYQIIWEYCNPLKADYLFLRKGWGKDAGTPLPRRQRGINPPTHTSLVIFVQAAVKHLFEMGREFPWPKPERCPRCGGRLWGHGFVTVWFDGFQDPLWLKRYRCPDCRCVIRLRPRGYFKRFQSAIPTIRDCLAYWMDYHRWKPGPSPPRQRHWFKALRKQLLIHWGLNRIKDLLAGFDWLWEQGIIPVSRSI